MAISSRMVLWGLICKVIHLSLRAALIFSSLKKLLIILHDFNRNNLIIMSDPPSSFYFNSPKQSLIQISSMLEDDNTGILPFPHKTSDSMWSMNSRHIN